MATNNSINSSCVNHAIIVGTGAGYTSASVGSNGQLLIGSTGADPVFATLTSSDSSVSFTTGAGTLSLQVAGGTTVGKTITGDSGGALSPTAGNWNLLGTGSVTTSGSGSSLTTQLTGLTNHVLIGAGTATITKVAPSATSGIPLVSGGSSADPSFTTAVVAGGGTGQVTLTNHGVLVGAGTTAITQLAAGSSGQVLQSGGASADPAYSTATFPSTATGTGTILRADGTNWVATTSTYPNTNAVSTLLYASSSNVMAALTTANSGVLTTDSSGVPSIDTTNFVRQTTGMQMKGNNTNTAPPAGFIGQRIEATATNVATTSTVAKTITSITLTAGVWDVTAFATAVYTNGTGIGTFFVLNLSTTDNTIVGTIGIETYDHVSTAGFTVASGSVPSYRVTISSNTVYYLVVANTYSATTAPTNGRLSATRVG